MNTMVDRCLKIPGIIFHPVGIKTEEEQIQKTGPG